ncbi:LysR family transcriptional regulator [Bordetella holmesii]|nr:LysR family transcriptional regulator [Bordetella holmesii]AHV91600.1 bacterial regulatory helix-turn-helix, lysR family protein [Bordetella holmesii ATCC 51541]AIT25251.1 bacterial regulatory helix-turn-helix, lysR family protein [Bordetella holmesii 44057]AMD44468.1 transcriptional regulator [Bordetella holmesii H558]AMD50025.1 transcriptional regulator [Bordetella holmesii F627]EWM45815.1 bacterial regulatory helix-turn-helix, lysR family protein [Bordetella holmesii 70147]EWM48422.1 ba
MDKLRAMELFLSISKTESFSETARQFGVSATSVSRMITEFESELNVKLLLRSTRQVVLTEAGQEYASQLDGILWSINEAHRNITEIRSAPKGILRVHSRMMFGLGVLPPLVAEFRQQYPDIHIELVLSEAKTDLRRNNFDIDFRISPPVEAGLKRRILFKSERYLVASPAYLARRSMPAQPADIATHACLAYLLPGEQYRWRFKRDDLIDDIPIQPRHVSNNGVALLELARLGEGIALLNDYTVQSDIARGTLARVFPDYRVTNTTFEEGMYATILDTAMIPAKIRLFLDFVADHVSGPALRFSAYKASAAGSD